MDETTLNDLLECSVCLERLDTTSKVLPCQHTFCKACLEVIVASHNELRCPECRVLVDIKIEDLPPNVLLMRILGGLKNSAAASTSTKATNEQTDKFEQNQQQLSQQKSLHSPNAQQQQQQLQRQPTVNTQRRCLLPHAYALYDFESSEPTDLHFKKGDLILLKHKIDSNWYVGQLKGAEGTFPSNYVQVMVPLPTPQAVALYDFKMQPNEEEGCLSFKKGAIVHVLRRVDQNWAEGRIGNAIGIFPIAFVELNALAKKLLQRSEPKTPQMLTQNSNPQQLQQCSAAARNLPPIPLLDPTTNTASDTTTSPSSESPSPHSIATTTSPSASENQHAPIANTSSSSNLSTNSNSLPNTPQHYAHESGGGSVRYRNGREKRHSLNALLLNGSGGAGNVTPGLSILQTNRHSAEILSIPSEELIVGSNEHQAAAAAMPQSSAAREQRQSGSTASSSSMQHGTTSRANVLKTACGPMNVPSTLPWGYLALYPYKPRKSDELELKKGCVYMVTERCLDGWFKGKNWQDISGVFPGNYVTPLRARDQQQLMHQWKFVPQQTMQQPQNSASNSSSAAASSTATHATAAATKLNQHKSTNIQDPTKIFPKPPELPPRHAATTTTCASVWTKPLSHTVEAFFNRGGSSASKNDDKSKEKETKTKESNSSGGAVSLMKRLTHIKSRAKSPGNTPARNAASSPTTTIATAVAALATVENSPTTTGGKSAENALQATAQLQPVHIRSGSCPSQLLQNLPQNATNQQVHKTQNPQQQQQHAANFINHGSERIKGHKERPRLQTNSTRQSMDGTLRGGIYANLNTAPTATMITNNFQLNPKCGQQFQMQQQQFMPTTHRKSHSLDANNMLSGGVVTNTSSMPAPPAPLTTLQPQASQMSMPNCNVTAAAVAQSATTKSAHCGRESRFRCIVPYPPNSDVELELHVGDIIYVQRKQKNGWYKGTHARTQKTGLFPASFVEPDF